MAGTSCPFIWIAYNTAVLAKLQAENPYTVVTPGHHNACERETCALWDAAHEQCAIKTAAEACGGPNA